MIARLFANHATACLRGWVLVILAALCFPAPRAAPAAQPDAAAPLEPLVLSPISRLVPGADRAISGMVRGRREPGIFWTLSGSGGEPLIHAVRADGSVTSSGQQSDVPGTRLDGAANRDCQGIGITASGELVIGDFGNSADARDDLCLYFAAEPATAGGVTAVTAQVRFRYPDQRSSPAPRDEPVFDAGSLFTIGDTVFILSRSRSDTFARLYRLDEREPEAVNTLTLVDRFDVRGPATGADTDESGLRLAVLTDRHIWLFERRDASEQFFAGRIRCREYRLEGGNGCAAICFENGGTLLIADAARADLFRVPIDEIPEVRPARRLAPAPTASSPAAEVAVMSFNIRYASARDGENSWPLRRDHVATVLREFDPDIVGMQEVEAVQAEWVRERFPHMAFHGVGRADGKAGGEFAPVLFRSGRFDLLSGGHFWLSPTPDVPGSMGWDAACERMASWVRLRDRHTDRELLVMNTHLDHRGRQARAHGLEMVLSRARQLADDAAVIILGDFNMSADGPEAVFASRVDAAASGEAAPPVLLFYDTFRRVFPSQDPCEATFSGFDGRILGERIDWILASESLETLDATIVRRMPRGRLASDHYPVTARLRFTADAHRP